MTYMFIVCIVIIYLMYIYHILSDKHNQIIINEHLNIHPLLQKLDKLRAYDDKTVNMIENKLNQLKYITKCTKINLLFNEIEGLFYKISFKLPNELKLEDAIDICMLHLKKIFDKKKYEICRRNNVEIYNQYTDTYIYERV